jgi:uncharacterized membrane protein YfcA
VSNSFGHAEFFSGMIAMGFLVVSVFFLRFWIRTKDNLYAAFALAFLLLATSGALIQLFDLGHEELSWAYLLRASAFSLLIVAVLDKNK